MLPLFALLALSVLVAVTDTTACAAAATSSAEDLESAPRHRQ
jgi:hypothetical protein